MPMAPPILLRIWVPLNRSKRVSLLAPPRVVGEAASRSACIALLLEPPEDAAKSSTVRAVAVLDCVGSLYVAPAPEEVRIMPLAASMREALVPDSPIELTPDSKKAVRHTPVATLEAFCRSGRPTRTVNPDASTRPNMSLVVHTMVFCAAIIM